METSISIRNCQTLPVPRQSRGISGLLNTDSMKGSAIWDDLLFALSEAKGVDFQPALVSSSTRQYDRGAVHIQILAPSSYLAGKGAGSVDRKGRPLTSNSVSAVVRLCLGGKPLALLPGDIDQVGFDNVLENGIDLRSPIVVFPHHGGRSGTRDVRKFSEQFCSATSPEIVVFSNGRGIHGTPRPEIIEALRAVVPEVRIVCTQLSAHCSDKLPVTDPSHLTPVHARGRSKRQCCAGTVLIKITGGA